MLRIWRKVRALLAGNRTSPASLNGWDTYNVVRFEIGVLDPFSGRRELVSMDMTPHVLARMSEPWFTSNIVAPMLSKLAQRRTLR